MLFYRVTPHRPGAAQGQAGHPRYVHPDQGSGRWDNPDLYRAIYLASSAEAAIGETFAHLSRWRATMLPFPTIPGSSRRLAVYSFDEEAHPVLDLDDAKALLNWHVRPSEVVIRNRPKTQGLAREVHATGTWAGISWWSMHRPQWQVQVLFGTGALALTAMEDLPGHPALILAAARLAKEVDPDLQ